MKKLYYLSVIMFSSAVLQAQPIINNMLNYTPGISIERKVCATASIDPGDAGPGNHWNFTNLQVVDSQSAYIVNPAATHFAASFPGATYAVRHDGGKFEYVYKTAGMNYALGNADSNSGNIVTYPDSLLEAVRPFTYTSFETDSFRILNGTTTGAGELTMSADADGMLHLPDAVYFDVLRIKTILHRIDTISSSPIPVTSEETTTRYAWYDDVHKSPLLLWDSTFIINSIGAFAVKTISYLEYESGTTSVPDQTAKALDFTASISNATLVVKGAFEPMTKYHIHLYTAEGKKVYYGIHVFDNGSGALDLQTDLSPGIYLLTISDNKGNQGFRKVSRN
jgi:hypothetical protein